MAIKPARHRIEQHTNYEEIGAPPPGDVLTKTADGWDAQAGGGPGGAHDVLSVTHPDTFAADVEADGEVLTWIAALTRWEARPPAAGTPGSTPTQIDIGDAQAGGADPNYSRNDHGHAFPAPGVGYPVDVAAAETDGVATTAARADHGHAHGSGYLPNAHHTQVDPGATPTQIDIGDAQAGGASADYSRNDHGHAFPAPGAGYPVDVAAAEADGAATTAARADHGHAHGSGYLPNAHHAQAHVLTGGDHSVAGEVAGEFLRATGAATFAIEPVPFVVEATVLDPAGAVAVIVLRALFAFTVTNVRGYRVGGTGATINARRNGVSNHLAADLSLTLADTWTDGGAVQNTAYIAGDKMELLVQSVAGDPTQVAVQVDCTRP